MALCTLHPSLSSLVSNLEAWEQLNYAALDANNEHLLQDHKEAKAPLSFKLEEQAANNIADSSIAKSLSSLGEGDRVLWSEQFLSKKSRSAQSQLLALLSAEVKQTEVAPKTYSDILELWDSFGKDLGKAARARDLHQRAESQLLDWTSNFYARLRGKRAVVLSNLNPLIVAGSWVSDIIRKIGGHAPELDANEDQIVIDWNYLKSFDPNTIVFAPLGYSLDESKKLFFDLEKLSANHKDCYEATSACKRGEVYFAEGNSNFYAMDYRILKTLGVIVSACAGFESGYISERDSFYKLRFLEMHRHKI